MSDDEEHEPEHKRLKHEDTEGDGEHFVMIELSLAKQIFRKLEEIQAQNDKMNKKIDQLTKDQKLLLGPKHQKRIKMNDVFPITNLTELQTVKEKLESDPEFEVYLSNRLEFKESIKDRQARHKMFRSLFADSLLQDCSWSVNPANRHRLDLDPVVNVLQDMWVNEDFDQTDFVLFMREAINKSRSRMASAKCRAQVPDGVYIVE